MILTHKNGASFYQFENLSQFPEIWHGIFTRRFGCSTGPFESLNVGFGLGDKTSHVKENRRVIARAIGLSVPDEPAGQHLMERNPGCSHCLILARQVGEVPGAHPFAVVPQVAVGARGQ